MGDGDIEIILISSLKQVHFCALGKFYSKRMFERYYVLFINSESLIRLLFPFPFRESIIIP